MPERFSNIYDNELLKISGLNWLPWIGSKYDDTKLLILGESFYEDGDEWLDNKFAPRHFVNNQGLNSSNPDHSKSRYLRNIERVVLFQQDTTLEERSNFWNSVSYLNVVQRLMASREERPKTYDFETGWKTILSLAEILKPKVCIKLGITGDGALGSYLNNNETGWTRNIAEFYAKPRIINLTKDDYNLKIIFINHPTGSYGFKYEYWANVIKEAAPNLL